MQEHITETGHGAGAILHVQDERDYQFGDQLGGGTPPFDWDKGFDIEHELQTILNDSNFKLPVKDQNGSFSCGGQAWSYLWEVLSAIHNKKFEEKSAKFIYSQTFIGTGGSDGRTNSALITKQGVSAEPLCPSYNAGNPPSEAFMEALGDITQSARDEAKNLLAGAYATVNTDIDSVATALRDMNGVVIGVDGANNGTWNSMYPNPPKDGQSQWHHWLFVGKAKMINGKKYIAVLNSWGNVGDMGWQWLSEDYFTNIAQGRKSVWVAWTEAVSNHPSELTLFTRTLMYGMKGDDVKQLQTLLGISADGIFGKVTLATLKAYQSSHGLVADGICGKHTQAELLKKN